jgi:hypothetical protein
LLQVAVKRVDFVIACAARLVRVDGDLKGLDGGSWEAKVRYVAGVVRSAAIAATMRLTRSSLAIFSTSETDRVPPSGLRSLRQSAITPPAGSQG